MSRNDNRAAVCGVEFLPVSRATVGNMPGNPAIRVGGTFVRLPIASAEFRESETNGTPVEQELEAVITSTGADNLSGYRDLLADYGLLRLTFTNGDVRVVGTDEFPVLVSTELSGTHRSLTLSFKRDSPEPSKIYSSF